MRRRDLLTYDVDQRPGSAWAGVNPRLAVLLLVVVALAVVLVIWTIRSPGPSPHSASPQAPARSTIPAPHRSSRSVTPRPTASPALVGSDADTSNRAPEGSKTAAAQFVAAWLQRAPKTRKKALADTAAPGLAEELMLTATDNIPKAHATGGPVLEHGSAYSVQFVQELSNGMRIRIYVVADPGSRYGWVTTSVERA